MPNAPTNLGAVKMDYRSIALSWQNGGGLPPAVAYAVQRKTGSGSFNTLATVIGLSYTDGAVVPDTEYTYQVIAYASSGPPSPPSASVTKRTDPITSPYDITVGDGPQNTLVIGWQSNGDTGLSFDVQHLLEGGSWVPATSTGGYILTITDMALQLNSRYQHRVIAKKQVFGTMYYSPPSAETPLTRVVIPAFLGFGLPVPVPAVVAALKPPAPFLDALSYRHMFLAWQHQQGVTRYHIQRSAGANTVNQYKDVPANTPVGSYVDFDDWQDLHIGVDYKYEIRAFLPSPGEFSLPTQGQVLSLNKIPEAVTVTAPEAGKLQVTWTYVSSSEGPTPDENIGWFLIRHDLAGGNQPIEPDPDDVTLEAGTYKFVDEDGLVQGHRYRYEVRAARDGTVSEVGFSPFEGTLVT